MAPSRGPSTATTVPQTPAHSPKSNDDLAIQQQSTSSLQTAKRNFSYLIAPIRYITQFIIWRLVRWAKYAAIAAVTTTVIGSLITPVAWIAAPTGIGASVAAATVWGVGKFVARRMQAKWEEKRKRGGKAEEDGLDRDVREEREREMRRKLERDGAGLKGMPW